MSGSGGGGGYQYQAQATAYITTHILAKEPLHWCEHFVPDVPVAVSAETNGPGDDIRIELKDRTAIELQAKHGLKKDKKFWNAIVKLIRGLAEDTSLYGVLLTDTTASSTIREELRKDIIRLGQGRRDDLKPISEELLTQLREQEIFYDLANLFRRLRIIVIDSEDTQREAKTAITSLAHILANSEQAAQTWKILCDDGLDLITKRGRRDIESLLQLLGGHDIQLSLVANLKTKDWLQVCRAMLDHQKQLSTNEIIASETMHFDLRNDEIFVSLALVERKEPDRLDQQVNPTKPVERYKEKPPIQYEVFREQVLRTRMSDRIAIVGEPGAGKTTLLQHIAFWLLDQELGLPIWISLGDMIKNGELQRLKEYLTQVWLEDAISNVTQDVKSNFLEQLNSQKVWLLLDGVDEIVASSSVELREISKQLQNWLGQACIVLTCRINVWDADISALRNFQTYRTKDFDYPTQVKQFIENGFRKSNKQSGQDLKTELAKSEQNRLQQLVRNPLRLMMLCTTWHEQEGLPSTKAELYQRFVGEFYKWNRAKWKKQALNFKFFPDTKPKQDKLNQALGHLACRALDEEASPFRLPHNLVFDELGDPEEEGSNFWLALNLGWLQVARNSEDASEKVYTFFHPTFQEYFAALAIDDWDFFLPRAHINKPVNGKKYRIFEFHWHEVISLWFGQDNQNEKFTLQKNELIEKVFSFQSGLELYFNYEDTILPFILECISQYDTCTIYEEIIEAAFNIGFGYEYEYGYDSLDFFFTELGYKIRKSFIHLKDDYVINFLIERVQFDNNGLFLKEIRGNYRDKGNILNNGLTPEEVRTYNSDEFESCSWNHMWLEVVKLLAIVGSGNTNVAEFFKELIQKCREMYNPHIDNCEDDRYPQELRQALGFVLKEDHSKLKEIFFELFPEFLDADLTEELIDFHVKIFSLSPNKYDFLNENQFTNENRAWIANYEEDIYVVIDQFFSDDYYRDEKFEELKLRLDSESFPYALNKLNIFFLLSRPRFIHENYIDFLFFCTQKMSYPDFYEAWNVPFSDGTDLLGVSEKKKS